MKNNLRPTVTPFLVMVFFYVCLIIIPIKSFGTVTIRLKNGTPMEGKLISVEDGKVTFESGGMQLTLPQDRFYAPDTEWLQDAEDAVSNSYFTKARELCQQILIWDSNNAKAKSILDQIKLKQNEIKLAQQKQEDEKKAEEQKAAVEKAKADALAQAEAAEAQKKPMEILQKVIKTFKDIKSFQIEGTITVESKAQGMNSSLDMPFMFAMVKPDKMRMNIKNPMAEMQIISDGKSTWMYMPQQNQYMKMPGSADIAKMGSQFAPLPEGISNYEDITENFKSVEVLREETIPFNGSSTGCYVMRLEAQMKEQNPMYDISPVICWIDKNNFIPIKITVAMAMKAQSVVIKTSCLATTFKLNESLADNLFVFIPPEGAKEASNPGGDSKEYANFSGKEAIDFTLNDMTGKSYNLKNLRGKVVLIDFWASWCPPCREELPTIEKLHKEMKDKGLVVLGINDEKLDVARGFVQKNNYTFPVLMDTQGSVNQQYQVEAIPTVLVIGKDGIVKVHFVGGRTETQLRAALKKAGME